MQSGNGCRIITDSGGTAKMRWQMHGRKRQPRGRFCGAVASLLVAMVGAPASAEIVLSKVIIDLHPGRPQYDDIEVSNEGPERMYVVAEPAEIQDPGKPEQRRVPALDPEQSGLLVTPQRLVLEPGQRRVVRISAVGARGSSDRVYRVAIKPVSGALSAEQSALKVFVGYDALVIYRPSDILGAITARRDGRRLTLTNRSNTAQEIFDGKQCDVGGANCRTLAANRIHAGASLEQEVPFDTPVEYHVSNGRRVEKVAY
jgi:Mat/Ecp fimbriae periplasmic chaperone